jgi:NAD(P)-dependent dehydrogenase (short-subunit alcohol dehydrogenase family)
VNGQKGAFGQTNYSAAKAGMHGFTKALALELARKRVTVNTISPGYIGTKMVMAIPKEILDSKILPQIPLNRQAGRDRRVDCLPVLGRGGFCHRRQCLHQWRSAHAMKASVPLTTSSH